LFGERGACGGCWRMWWRLKRSEFAKRTGQKNKRAMKRIIGSGQVPGLLAYAGGNPARAGFVEALRRSPSRPITRYFVSEE
jgi:hypothetical protein